MPVKSCARDGDGVLECTLNVVAIRRGTGIMLCEMDFTTEFNNGLFVRIKWTNPSNPVTNVRVFLPGFDAGVVIGGASSAMKQFGATAMKAAHVYQTKGEGGAVSRVLSLSAV